MAEATDDYWTITPTALFDFINENRRQLNRSPIDHGAMSTRLTLKCNIVAPGVFDFGASKLKLKAEQIQTLEGIVNDQFDLYLEKVLIRRCTAQSDASKQSAPKAPTPAPAPLEKPQPEGIGAKIKRLFGMN